MRTSFLPVPCGASVSAGALTDKLAPSGCRGENRNAFKIKLCINPAWNRISSDALSRTDISCLMTVISNKNTLVDVFLTFLWFLQLNCWGFFFVFFLLLTCVSLSQQQPFYFHKNTNEWGGRKKKPRTDVKNRCLKRAFLKLPIGEFALLEVGQGRWKTIL